MKSLYKVLILSVFFSSVVFSQTERSDPFSGRFNLGIGGGFTITKSDYQESQTGVILKGALEYFFPTSSPSSFGLRLFGGGMTANGKDDRRLVNEFSTDINMIGLGLIYSYSIKNNVFPYLYAGISTNWFNPKTSEGRRAPNNSDNLYEKNAISYDVEFGLRIPVSNNFILRVASGVHFLNTDLIDDISPEFELEDFPAGPNNDFVATGIIGISYAFSGTKDSDGDGIDDKIDMCPNTPSGIIIDEYGCPLDSDRDGVADYIDECSGTSRGVPVDEKGCPVDSDKDGVPDTKDKCPDTPLGIAVDDQGCSSDLDDDGIADYLDECPGTGAGISVDGKGCPNDADFDGVLDSIDICPDTPAGVLVDEFGCGTSKVDTEQKIETQKKDTAPEVKKVPDVNIDDNKKTEETKSSLPPITSGTNKIVLQSDEIFISGTSRINPGAYNNLNRIIDFLKKDPWTKWKIQGYVDNQAPESKKASLSYEKANSIMNYFIEHGLPSFQFQVYGLGDDSPVASNNNPEGRSQNRRVELEKIKK